MAETAFWQWLVEMMSAGEAVALLIVVAGRGSTPGKPGAKMAVSAAAETGTIGGGLIEAELVNLARRGLRESEGGAQIVRRVHHPSPSIEASGMICGGEQSVLLYLCRPDDRCLFQRLVDYCRLGEAVTLTWSAHGPALSAEAAETAPIFQDGENWCYRETVGRRKRAYIVGGGHVGLALAKLLAMLDFEITLLDDRPLLDRASAFPQASWRCGIAYTDIATEIPGGEWSFVFVMTHSHHSDALVLRQLAGKRFAYFGLLGSRHKIACLREELAEQWPAGLHAPMGLSIHSHTPMEIAVSIAAELIELVNFRSM